MDLKIAAVIMGLSTFTFSHKALANNYGSCTLIDEAMCIEYLGPVYAGNEELLEQACIEEGGVYVKDGCAQERSIGPCHMGLESDDTYDIFFYPPTPVDLARNACQSSGGTFEE